ncbi:hypothetical protein [Streptomyces sp. NPDC006477]|uniref:hypothetical protein n=1 Tax=Streptomyces sp. NPDC006477 TaxID=3364747 RepID=UPI0036B57339
MTTQYQAPICDRCSQPITGRVQRVPSFSTSGARPDATYHAEAWACGRPPQGAPEVAPTLTP